MESSEVLVESEADDELGKYKTDAGFAAKWLKEDLLVRGSKENKAFENVGEKIVREYKNSAAMGIYDKGNGPVGRAMYNVLWVVVNMQVPAVFSRVPKYLVERRWKDKDPVGRVASMLGERATQYAISKQNDRFICAVRGATQDRFLCGRGQAWVRYEASFDEDEALIPGSEQVIIDPLCWLDYAHSKARNPYEIRWHRRRVFMTREELRERFPDCADHMSLTFTPETGRKKSVDDDTPDYVKQAEVLEFHDLKTRQVIWVSEGYKEGALDVKDDPLGLDEFFPCPDPLLATITTDSMWPTPDYKIWERLAHELDGVTKRISGLVDCIRLVGLVAKQFHQDVKKLRSLEDGDLSPTEAFAAFQNAGGFDRIIDWLPFENAVAALPTLFQYQELLMSQIRQINRIPDIASGVSDPVDPVYTQQLKSKAMSMGIEDIRGDVMRFCKQLGTKIFQIIFQEGLFADETIYQMAGAAQFSEADQMLLPQALALLRDDRLSSFRLEVETDSMIQLDEEINSNRWMAYMSAMKDLTSTIAEVQQYRPELVRPMTSAAMAAVRSLRTGRVVEGEFEKAMELIEQNDEQVAQQPQQPDPAMIEMQMRQQELQIKQQELQIKGEELGIKQADAQNKMQGNQISMMDSQQDYELGKEKNQLKMVELQGKQAMEATKGDLNQMKETFKAQLEAAYLKLDEANAQLQMLDRMQDNHRLQSEQDVEHRKMTISAETAKNDQLLVARQQTLDHNARIIDSHNKKSGDSKNNSKSTKNSKSIKN